MQTDAQKRASNKYIKKNYTGFTIKLPNDTADEFKKMCEMNGVSVRSVLKQAIEDYISLNIK